ncbi:cell wall-binding repeat-containing protein [Caloramator sp. mosi_1]|uniref:cell wall-binding repeat-containing protein n=1 Tax=Caloramator sp. mosi_1 TaxID=3023090 RepID=UPI00235FB08E|nr:cell wall-binding repeat-containing protein [Caloramator sp. mosi_1]WDC85106.1 cell wall-binding repeat-containing protein [Caloramator sp. mosi_1]
MLYIRGTGVIGEGVESKIIELGFEVERIGGVDRYDTNDKTNSKLDDFSTIIVVNGESFADALSISSISAIKDYPIVLVSKDNIRESSVKYIEKANKVFVIGGTGVVSNSVVNRIKSINENIDIIRIGGGDRYDTSKKIAEYFKDEFNDYVIVANGLNFPDALSGVCLAKEKKAPILLTANENIDIYYKGYINEKMYPRLIY